MDELSWVLDFRNDGLTMFFRVLSWLGEEIFLMGILAIGYWCFNKKLYRNVVFMLCVSTLVNVLLKAMFKMPRPTIEYLAAVNDIYSFPSGHAQIVTVFWLMLAVYYKRILLWWCAGFMILGECLSRVYLGVHYPTDVLFGTFVGAMLVVCYTFLRNSLYWSLFSKRKLTMASLFIGGTVLYLFYMKGNYSKSNIIASGALIGVVLGHLLENKYCKYQNPSDPLLRIVTAVLGLATVFVVKYTLKAFAPEASIPINNMYTFGMYFVMGITIVYLVPLLMKKISGVCSGEDDRLGSLVES